MIQSVVENEGTSPSEVFIVTFFVPLSTLLLQLISKPKWFSWLEVVCFHLILLLTLTSFSDHLFILLVIHGVLTCGALWLTFSKLTLKEFLFKLRAINYDLMEVKSLNQDFIGDYRGHLLLATSICILAVDFKIFPSKFAKTETFGWSVMDAGVGSFVVLHGLCSTHGKRIKESSLRKCFNSSFPLFLLGLIRLALTTAVGYHKVVPEYGMHWNFFFTLALTKVICYSSLVILLASPGLLAAITVIIHQLCLTKLGLSDLVLSSERRNLFEANKEGICSLLGFAALYFAGVQMGQIVWQKKSKIKDYFVLLVKLCGSGLCGWLLMYVFHERIESVSRRMANLAYCIWIVSLTSLQISVHLCHRLVTIILKDKLNVKLCDNVLWNTINYNGLLYFLVANVLTGFVNLTIDTENSSNLKSLIILILYLTSLFLISFKLFNSNIKIFASKSSILKKSH